MKTCGAGFHPYVTEYLLEFYKLSESGYEEIAFDSSICSLITISFELYALASSSVLDSKTLLNPDLYWLSSGGGEVSFDLDRDFGK